jgi:hypothetical protein
LRISTANTNCIRRLMNYCFVCRIILFWGFVEYFKIYCIFAKPVMKLIYAEKLPNTVPIKTQESGGLYQNCWKSCTSIHAKLVRTMCNLTWKKAKQNVRALRAVLDSNPAVFHFWWLTCSQSIGRYCIHLRSQPLCICECPYVCQHALIKLYTNLLTLYSNHHFTHHFLIYSLNSLWHSLNATTQLCALKSCAFKIGWRTVCNLRIIVVTKLLSCGYLKQCYCMCSAWVHKCWSVNSACA